MTIKNKVKIVTMKLKEGDFTAFEIDAPKGTDKAVTQIAINKIGEIYHDEFEALLTNVNETLNEIMEAQQKD